MIIIDNACIILGKAVKDLNGFIVIMRRIYTFFLYLLVPYIVLRLYWKGRRFPAYRKRILERFSCGPILSPVDVWVHAVSLGEVVAATPLLESLLAKRYRVLVTTMTPSGSERVLATFADRVQHQYVPYDLPWCLKRFFKQIKARVGVIMETELWPNLINQAKLAHVPLALVNARLSDKAFSHYRKVQFFFKPILKQFDIIGAQSALDALRYIELGAPSPRVQMLGNMKFDMKIPVLDSEKTAQFKQAWGDTRPVLIAASTHEGEEALLLTRLVQLKAGMGDMILLIAPRRPERFHQVYELSQKHGFRTAKRSQPETITPDTDVVVLDCLGELLSFYHLSDYAFVGGSLVPVGGHNVLEPIALKVPVFCGPFMQNSKAICTDLKVAKAIQWTDGIDALSDAILTMHQNPTQCATQVVNASAVLEANQGTVLRYMEVIETLMRLE